MSSKGLRPGTEIELDRSGAGFWTYLIGCASVLVLAYGWHQRDEDYLTPRAGTGYWLGITGSLMMLTLLYYAYRKRQKPGRGIGSIPLWFRIHMILGIAGPVFVILHSNFQLGAMNSNMALFTMLTVAASGLVGRYLYGRIHVGVYGRKVVAQEVRADLEELRRHFGDRTHIVDPVFDRLDAFGKHVIEATPAGALGTLVFGGIQVVKGRLLQWQSRPMLKNLVDAEAAARRWSPDERRRVLTDLQDGVSVYTNATLKVAELQFFERLFSLWHMLHQPLIFLMIFTALVHVWAVHWY